MADIIINKEFINNLMKMVLSNDVEDAKLAENILGNILRDDNEKEAFAIELDKYWEGETVASTDSKSKVYSSYLKLCLLHTAMEMKINNHTRNMDPELSKNLQDENFYNNVLQLTHSNIKFKDEI